MKKKAVYTVLLTQAQILELLEASRRPDAVAYPQDLSEARDVLKRTVKQPKSYQNQENTYGKASNNS